MNERTEIFGAKPQIFVQQNEVVEQKKYKDTVFRLLFSDRKSRNRRRNKTVFIDSI